MAKLHTDPELNVHRDCSTSNRWRPEAGFQTPVEHRKKGEQQSPTNVTESAVRQQRFRCVCVGCGLRRVKVNASPQHRK
ncbi:kinase sensor protein [Anopheles sinensis]|uniref:Kinase sensor protein n=1 Tax=Anopheles sinensis TaxID=74873 RepID=A0A084WT16_ANOSI|nr:kinase sensor protein [Anopheles sinensis]